MKSKFFIHVVANFLIITTVAIVFSVTFIGGTSDVFGKTDSAPIYRSSATDKVALMINVYWGTEYLDGFLDIFKKYDVKCTFFVGGCWVAEHSEYLKKIVADGHEVGNHGFFHKQHSKLSYQQNADEMLMCGKLVFDCCGVYPTLFAPPSGDFSDETLKAAYDNGLKTIMWSRDTIDWRDKDADLVFSRATKQTEGGEFVLMHPTSHTLQALEKTVKYFLSKNIRPSSVGEMLTQAS